MISRIFLFFLFFVSSHNFYAQDDMSNSYPKGTIDVFYGTRLFIAGFENQLNTLSNFSIDQPLQMPGFGVSDDLIVNRGHNVAGALIFSHMIPANIRINDTIDCKITGGMLSFCLYGKDLFVNSEIFALYASSGLSLGRLRIYGNDYARMKNPYIAPTITLQPKLLLGKFSIGLVAAFAYDISDPNWKKTWMFDGKVNSVKKYRQTAVNAFLSIGIKFV